MKFNCGKSYMEADRAGARRGDPPPADGVEDMKYRALALVNARAMMFELRHHFESNEDFDGARDDLAKAILSSRLIILTREDLRRYLPVAYQTEERIEKELRTQISNLERQFIEVEKMLCAVLGREWQPSGMSIVTLIDDIKKRYAPLDSPRDHSLAE